MQIKSQFWKVINVENLYVIDTFIIYPVIFRRVSSLIYKTKVPYTQRDLCSRYYQLFIGDLTMSYAIIIIYP